MAYHKDATPFIYFKVLQNLHSVKNTIRTTNPEHAGARLFLNIRIMKIKINKKSLGAKNGCLNSNKQTKKKQSKYIFEKFDYILC